VKRLALLLLLSLTAFANDSWDAEIGDLLKTYGDKALPARVESYSAAWKGRATTFGPLGEGPDGVYDRDPLYRTDYFDCMTYVETVVGMSLAGDLRGFAERMDQIRYKDGIVGFTTRNHFPDLDWIPNNQSFLTDITAEVAGAGKSIVAEALISKKGWYANLKLDAIKRPDLTEDQKQEKLAELRKEGAAFDDKLGTIPYVPFTVLFPNGTEDPAVFDRIPSGTLINIVRPNWDLVDYSGTHMNVSHQGFAIRVDGVLYYRHATSVGAKKVIDTVLVDYLKPYLTSPTIKGINLQALKQVK